MLDIAKKDNRGGKRPGSGRKKGIKGPNNHSSKMVSLSNNLWIFLSKDANGRGITRSKYINQLVSAMLQKNIETDLNIKNMTEAEFNIYFSLTQSAPHSSTYISMKNDTWKKFEEIQNEKNLKRSKLFENILITYFILLGTKNFKIGT